MKYTFTSQNQRYLNEIDSFGGKKIATSYRQTNIFGPIFSILSQFVE